MEADNPGDAVVCEANDVITDNLDSTKPFKF